MCLIQDYNTILQQQFILACTQTARQNTFQRQSKADYTNRHACIYKHIHQFKSNFPGDLTSAGCSLILGIIGAIRLRAWMLFLMTTRGITQWTILASSTDSKG